MDITLRKEHKTHVSARLLAAMAVAAFTAVSCQDTDRIESPTVWLTPSFTAMNTEAAGTRITVGEGTGNFQPVTKDGTSVQAFAHKTGGTGEAGDVTAGFTYSETKNKWEGKIGLKVGNIYDAFAYSGAGSAQMTGPTTMKITGIPVVTETDPMVSVASCVKNKVADHSGYLTPGTFTTGPNAIVSPAPTDDWKISFAMEHLYAGVKFNFKVQHADKVQRTFVLTSATLIYTSSATVDATVTMGSTLVNNVAFSNYQGTKCEAGIFAGTKTLTESYQSIEASFLPNEVTHLQLKCTYDIKDRQGTVVRGGCTATNNIHLEGTTPCGTQRTYNININPTYLYQMSDGDIDSPAFTITNE